MTVMTIRFRGCKYELVVTHLDDDLAHTNVYQGDELLFRVPGILDLDTAPAALAAYRAGCEAGESALRERLVVQALRAVSSLQPLRSLRVARVKVLVLVDSEGRYAASGYTDGDAPADFDACRGVTDLSLEEMTPVTRYAWLEADVPLPEVAAAPARVSSP